MSRTRSTWRSQVRSKLDLFNIQSLYWTLSYMFYSITHISGYILALEQVMLFLTWIVNYSSNAAHLREHPCPPLLPVALSRAVTSRAVTSRTVTSRAVMSRAVMSRAAVTSRAVRSRTTQWKSTISLRWFSVSHTCSTSTIGDVLRMWSSQMVYKQHNCWLSSSRW